MKKKRKGKEKQNDKMSIKETMANKDIFGVLEFIVRERKLEEKKAHSFHSLKIIKGLMMFI